MDGPEPDGDGGSTEGLKRFYGGSGAPPGEADIFALGFASTFRAGRHAALLLGMGTGAGALFDRIVVVLPPTADREAARDLISEAFRGTLLAMHADLGAAPLERLFARVELARAIDLTVAGVAAIVRRGRPRTAFVVVDAARYRAPLPPPELRDDPMPEDLWAAHAKALAEGAVEAARAARAYVALDLGEWAPERDATDELLKSIEDCGYVAAAAEGSGTLDIARMFGRWFASAREGAPGEALSEIEAFAGWSAAKKLIARSKILVAAGMLSEAAASLQGGEDLIAAEGGEMVLAFAEIAEAVDMDDLASGLLDRCAPGLETAEAMARALALAVRLGREKAILAAEAALEAADPGASALLDRRVARHVAARDYGGAAAALEASGRGEVVADIRYLRMLASFVSDRPIDVAALIEAARPFGRAADALREGARALEAAGRRPEALHFLLDGVDGVGPDRASLWMAIAIMERALIACGGESVGPDVQRVLAAGISHLAGNPDDGRTRIRLLRMLSPQVLGARAVPTIVKAVLEQAKRASGVRPRAPLAARARKCDPDLLPGILRHGLDHFGKEPAMFIGRTRYPVEHLPAPAETVVAALLGVIETAGERFGEDGDARLIETCLAFAGSIAPLGTEPDEDLTVIRAAAGRFAQFGLAQRARDLAEHALSITNGSKHRARLAWHAFADVYARCGHAVEALLALACAFAADDEATWDQVWGENLLLLRLMRDTGLASLTRPMLGRAREALDRLGAGERHAHLLDTVELQLECVQADHSAPDREWLAGALLRATANVRTVLAHNDDPAPSAILLATLRRLAADAGVAIPITAERAGAEVNGRLGAAARALVAISGEEPPTVKAVMDIARQLEAVRYAEDVAYDGRNLALAASRLLASPEAMDPSVAALAIEMMADHALAVAGTGAGESPFPTAGAPAERATAISRLGIPVVMLGLSDRRLTKVVASAGELSIAVEPEARFSAAAFADWTAAFPAGYGGAAPDTFFSSTEALALDDLPERAVVVAAVDLQAFPPNLLQVRGGLAGQTRRLAVAPSLSWLAATMGSPWSGDGRMRAWIPDAEASEGWSTLKNVAFGLEDSFARHGIRSSNELRDLGDLSGSDLAIVVAHGDISAEGRYFRAVADDADAATSTTALCGALAGAGLVVLLVCSGGRMDTHPNARTTIGLAKELLARGSRAVVAPPWPIAASVAEKWLPNFLDCWMSGREVVDACFEANDAMRMRHGHDPGADLAMTVYGDPTFRRRTGLPPTDIPPTRPRIACGSD